MMGRMTISRGRAVVWLTSVAAPVVLFLTTLLLVNSRSTAFVRSPIPRNPQSPFSNFSGSKKVLPRYPSDPSSSRIGMHSSASAGAAPLEGGLHVPPSKQGGLRDRLDALYRFTRPHTIRGTILASLMGVFRCFLEHPKAFANPLQPMPRAILGLLALLCGNVFIVGINQIYDVEIDKVNKPFLPLAAQRMTGKAAWAVVLAAGAGGLAITKSFFTPLIFNMYAAGIVAGTLYSVPPFYFKRFPLIAAATIAFVRGFSLNFGVYYAVREALGIPFAWNPIVLFITRFMTIFAGVIAVSKDLPDTEGDKKYNVRTFATRVGVKNMARGAAGVLFLNYLSAIAQGVVNPSGAFRQWVMVGGHTVLAALLIQRYKKLEPDSLASIKAFYKSIWDLFYLEYALYPFL
ncbi:tocopherol polyprenyltransferase-like protein [Nannochloropsis gaditana]|uniref:Tocopherol polyprenyltransferase-like protein n=1 Tax=Nannochloropsis gaditana TaxID=72520 RepID=W7TS50_9STRA|nr:tocopherol polyprenyltransferase-like protein [Nannochloropsis gaditana]